MSSVFTQDDLESDTYRWRDSGRGTMVHIFYQTFPLGQNAGEKNQWRRTVEDQSGTKIDIDSMCLKHFFEDNKQSFPFGVKVETPRRLKSFDETMQILQEMDVADKKTEFEQYDCFCFAFLTFAEVDGRLHFNDTTLEKGLVPLEKILEVVSGLEVARGKPKIFLIQADDMSLTSPEKFTKGAEETKKVKIPTDSDRLIIQSNIPQKIVPGEVSDITDPDIIRSASFLIQAFVKVMKENFGNKNKTDLFSLTCKINGGVRDMINDVKPDPVRKADLQVPLVTSTLAKRLAFSVRCDTQV